jgi:hypothetical protein
MQKAEARLDKEEAESRAKHGRGLARGRGNRQRLGKIVARLCRGLAKQRREARQRRKERKKERRFGSTAMFPSRIFIDGKKAGTVLETEKRRAEYHATESLPQGRASWCGGVTCNKKPKRRALSSESVHDTNACSLYRPFE